MGLRLSIHANGGYDVVAVDESGKEGSMLEFVGYALDPFELDSVAEKFSSEGAIVTDFRSPKKRELATKARLAVESAKNLILHSIEKGGVEIEAIEKAKKYANECLRLAVEESC